MKFSYFFTNEDVWSSWWIAAQVSPERDMDDNKHNLINVLRCRWGDVKQLFTFDMQLSGNNTLTGHFLFSGNGCSTHAAWEKKILITMLIFQQCEVVRKTLEKVNIDSDLQLFVSKAQTGCEKPGEIFNVLYSYISYKHLMKFNENIGNSSGTNII